MNLRRSIITCLPGLILTALLLPGCVVKKELDLSREWLDQNSFYEVQKIYTTLSGNQPIYLQDLLMLEKAGNSFVFYFGNGEVMQLDENELIRVSVLVQDTRGTNLSYAYTIGATTASILAGAALYGLIVLTTEWLSVCM